VSEAIGGLLPQQKLDKIRELLRQGRKMVMVGGVNDAPAIRVNDPAIEKSIVNRGLGRGFSCHPSLLNSGGQRVHVLRKQHYLPYLTVRQRLAEGGHSGKANAVSNLPVYLSLGVILYSILGKLWCVRR
jgi:hypothetical protein